MKNTLICPGCEGELAEADVKLKITKDKREAKVRCIICHRSWKVPLDLLSEKARAKLLSS